MKIAVLFGSFNPLANAHIALLKTAVGGLFVATNAKDRVNRRPVSFDPGRASGDH